MKLKLLYLTAFIGLLVSCKDNSKEKEAENLRASQKQDSIFNAINTAWQFSNKPFNPTTQSIIDNWNDWKSFHSELAQKPKSTISAFQQKAKAITVKADQLNKNIPEVFNIPPIRSRITTLVTKIKALEAFINLDDIPDKKVITLISDINIEIGALQEQMQITTMRTTIRLEEGEAEMLKSLADTLKVKTIETEKGLK